MKSLIKLLMGNKKPAVVRGKRETEAIWASAQINRMGQLGQKLVTMSKMS